MSAEPETKDCDLPGKTIHVIVTSTSAAKDVSSPMGRVLEISRSVLEAVGKALPGLAMLIAIFMFHHEISDFLRSASKVEILGLKMEKGEFDKGLAASRKKLGADVGQPMWTEVPFRKLNLAAPLLKGMRILWVDDHPENNFFLRKILVDLDIQIVVALNNKEALEQIRRHDFHIVISDFGRDLPLQETGGDLATAITNIGYDVPLLFYTARPESVPKYLSSVLATNDPAMLLSTIAELAVAQRK